MHPKRLLPLLAIAWLTIAASQPAPADGEPPIELEAIPDSETVPPETVPADDSDPTSVSDSRIVEGKTAPPGTAPWQVAIYSTLTPYNAEERAADALRPRGSNDKIYLDVRKDYEIAHKCGGSYIGDGWVITAAHCVVGLPVIDGRKGNVLTDRRIMMGSQSLISGGTNYGIERVIWHAGYSKKVPKDDIALVKLAGPVASAGVRKIDLQPANDPVGPNEILRVTGWGWMGASLGTESARLDRNGNVQRKPANLLYAPVNSVAESECKAVAGYRGFWNPAKTLCVGSAPMVIRDSCQGDSGGPLTRSNKAGGGRHLVGIVSQGVGCAQRKVPALYTRVGGYLDWIERAKRVTKPGVTALR
jgi:secreted trypsin-like serine protease